MSEISSNKFFLIIYQIKDQKNFESIFQPIPY